MEKTNFEARGMREPVSKKLQKYAAMGVGFAAALGMMGDFKTAAETLMGAAGVSIATKEKSE